MHWGVSALSLWIASHVFRGLRFADGASVLVAALLLGIANAVIKPLLIVLTLPLTLITLGLFILVINAAMILLVARLVRGFRCDGFWTALWASLLIGLLSIVIESLLAYSDQGANTPMPHSGLWL
jgi:putative membrane protein